MGGRLGGKGHGEVSFLSCEGLLSDSVSRMIIPLWMNWDGWGEMTALASLCLTEGAAGRRETGPLTAAGRDGLCT